jgi:hypothetical protein
VSRKRQRGRRDRSASDSSSSSSSSSDSRISISSDEDDAGFTRKQARRAKRRFRAVNRFWARERRPDFLQTWQGCADFSVSEIQDMQSKMEKEAEKQNLGEDIFNRDSKPKKIKFKAQTDNGTSKLHEARYLRPPIAQPKDYFGKILQKRTEIIRNFPMEHYGMQGQVPDATIGRMHNRTVLQTFDAFGKFSQRQGKGKYPDRHQLEEGLLNYGSMQNAIWPLDYSTFVIWRVLHKAMWGEKVTSDEKRRYELVVEFFNTILADNAALAVNSQCPLGFDQVTLPN